MASVDTEIIPDFLIDRLENLDEGTLQDVSTYAHDTKGRVPEGVPDNIANPLYMQDDEVCEAVADYAEALAEGEIGAGPDDGDDEDDENDEDDDEGPDYMMGPAFG